METRSGTHGQMGPGSRPHAEGQEYPRRGARWWLLAVATLQQAGLTFVRFGLPTVVPFIRADLGLSLAQTGAVLGAFDLGALLAFYLTGMATDRFGERRVMGTGALLTAAWTAAAAGAPGVGVLAALLAVAGVGFPSSQVAGSHAVMGWFPARERGVAMGVRQAGLPAGGLSAALVLPWAASRWGWRAALAVAAAGCALAGLATLVGLAGADQAASGASSDGRGVRRQGADGGRRPGFWEAPRRFVRTRGLVLTTLMACLLGASQFSLTGYLPLYMVDRFGWERQAAARLLLVVHLGGIAGRLLWGWVSDRWFGADRVGPLALVCGAGAAAAVGVAGLSAWGSLPLLAAEAAALAGGMTLLGWNGLYVTRISELAGEASAVMLGLSMTVLYVWTMLAPPAFGWLVERVGGHYALAWAALGALPLGALVAIAASRRPGVVGEGAGAAAGTTAAWGPGSHKPG